MARSTKSHVTSSSQTQTLGGRTSSMPGRPDSSNACSTFTVLFIGYSHGDVVMQYLARSLGPSGKRFVCAGDGDNPIWRQSGLTPVPYVVDNGDHAALPAFISRWAELSAMGQTQHRALVFDLVAAGPPTVPEEVSYLDETLEHPERIRYFVEKAQGPQWLEWVAARPAFQSLFVGMKQRP